MKRTITWIRHGESEWNAAGKWQGHTDIALSSAGRRQAEALRKRLATYSYDLVYSSDLGRALETATISAREAPVVSPLLREIHFGIYEGKSQKELSREEHSEVMRWWSSPYDFKLPGGESMECVNTRIGRWLESLPEECSVLAFTHGGVVRNAIWQIVGKPSQAAWSLAIDNTSLTVIEYTTSKTLIKRVNDAAHLEGAHELPSKRPTEIGRSE